jgi:MarR family transcriptional regulator, temperature-dependent positive regulator of motility
MSGSKEQKPFARSFSHLLKRATQYSVHHYMQDAGHSGLTHRQFTVLAAVDAFEGKSQTELVRVTGIDRSTLADLVARLMQQGLLQRRRSKEDARTNSVRLTPVGKKALKTAQSGADDVDKTMLAMFSPSDRKTLIDCLSLVATEMDRIDTESGEEKPQGKVRLKRKV